MWNAGGVPDWNAESAEGLTPGISWRRLGSGTAVAILVPTLLAWMLLPVRDGLGLDTVLLLFVLVTVIASVVGAVVPALISATVSFGLANFYFARPYGSLLVASTAELLDLVIFFAVAVLVGVATELGGRARERAERARLRAEWLAEIGARQPNAATLEQVLAEAQALFGMHQVQLLVGNEVKVEVGRWEADDVSLALEAGEGIELRLNGPTRVGEDRSLLSTVALTTGQLWRTLDLAQKAKRAEELARIDELRASLLGAVGHDLRNPLAAISVAASTLSEPALDLTQEDRQELLATIQEHIERLDSIIANLLDASRLQTGALSVHSEPTALQSVLGGVIRPDPSRVELDIPEDLPLVQADSGLLERVLANLVSNAERQLGVGESVLVRAGVVGRQVEISVVDHGPGVPPERFTEMFAPFQHFDDRSTDGIGLGLAIARGFTEAMGGILTPSRTPGGGLTMTVRLEVAKVGTLAGS